MEKKVYHLLGGHAYSLDGELASTHIEEIFQVGTEKVNDQDVVETLLPKIIHLRHTSCHRRTTFRSGSLDCKKKTDQFHSKSCMSETRLVVEEHRTFEVPVEERMSGVEGAKESVSVQILWPRVGSWSP